MCAENCALRRCSVSTLVRMSSHTNFATNHQNADRAALERPGRLHLVIRKNGRGNGGAKPLTYAAVEHTRAAAQGRWALVFGSRATRPCTLAWPTQLFSASCGVTQNAHVHLCTVSTRQNCGCSGRHLPARAWCRIHWQMSWRFG